MRHNYFRLRKTDVRHIRIFLPIATSTIPQEPACYPASGYQVSSKSGQPLRSCDVEYMFKMAAAVDQYYFRFCMQWCHFHPKVKIYPQTKFRWRILFHGWDIAIFDLEKQTSAMSKFFFPWRFWPDRNNLRAILNLVPTFRLSRDTRGGVRWRPRRLHTTSGFIFDDGTLFRKSTSISKPNFIGIS